MVVNVDERRMSDERVRVIRAQTIHHLHGFGMLALVLDFSVDDEPVGAQLQHLLSDLDLPFDVIAETAPVAENLQPRSMTSADQVAVELRPPGRAVARFDHEKVHADAFLVVDEVLQCAGPHIGLGLRKNVNPVALPHVVRVN